MCQAVNHTVKLQSEQKITFLVLHELAIFGEDKSNNYMDIH